MSEVGFLRIIILIHLQVILGIVLALLAVVGFVFNFYIVLALVLTKQASPSSY